MTRWTPEQLRAIDRVDELRVQTRRADGSLPRGVPVWGVSTDGSVFVRSVWGAGSAWYRRALAQGSGRLHAGPVDTEAAFSRVDPDDAALHDRIDAAYHAKYDHHGRIHVDPTVTRAVRALTIRVMPR